MHPFPNENPLLFSRRAAHNASLGRIGSAIERIELANLDHQVNGGKSAAAINGQKCPFPSCRFAWFPVTDLREWPLFLLCPPPAFCKNATDFSVSVLFLFCVFVWTVDVCVGRIDKRGYSDQWRGRSSFTPCFLNVVHTENHYVGVKCGSAWVAVKGNLRPWTVLHKRESGRFSRRYDSCQ